MKIDGIGTYHPDDPDQAQAWVRIASFVAKMGTAAFSRDPHIGGHVTGSAFVLSPDGCSVLLTHHRKLNLWLQLGGHCDGIADVRFVALKEAYEESGLARIRQLSDTPLDVDIHRIPANATDPAHLHYDIRYLMRAEAGQIRASEESHELAWVPLDDLDSRCPDPGLIRMREAAAKMLP